MAERIRFSDNKQTNEKKKKFKSSEIDNAKKGKKKDISICIRKDGSCIFSFLFFFKSV